MGILSDLIKQIFDSIEKETEITLLEFVDGICKGDYAMANAVVRYAEEEGNQFAVYIKDTVLEEEKFGMYVPCISIQQDKLEWTGYTCPQGIGEIRISVNRDAWEYVTLIFHAV